MIYLVSEYIIADSSVVYIVLYADGLPTGQPSLTPPLCNTYLEACRSRVKLRNSGADPVIEMLIESLCHVTEDEDTGSTFHPATKSPNTLPLSRVSRPICCRGPTRSRSYRANPQSIDLPLGPTPIDAGGNANRHVYTSVLS